MTYKEKIRFLEQYQSNLSRQRMLEEEIEQMRSEATRMTAVLSGMPGAKGGAQDRIPRAVERIVEAQTRLETQLAGCFSARGQVTQAISTVTVEQQREVLRRRYILGQSFEEIGGQMGLVPRRAYQLHRAGVDSISL